jgi:BlaI family penicillinase repressor
MGTAPELSRRERQIMDVVYAQNKASASEVLELMSDPPTRTSIRTILRILEEKGHLKHETVGREFVYYPTRPREKVGRSTFARVLQTFFDGSLEKAVASHLCDPANEVSEAELKRISQLIAEARKREGSK